MNEVTTTTDNQLGLFQFSKPGESVSRFLAMRELKKGDKAIGAGMKLAKRKDIASMLNLSPKKDGLALDKEMLRLSDDLKSVITREFSGYASSPDYTGLDYTVRRDKHGMATITAKIKQVKRQAPVMSDEEIAKMLGLPIDKVVEMKKQASQPPIESKPEPTDEQIAEATGFSVEEIAQMRAERAAKQSKQAEPGNDTPEGEKSQDGASEAQDGAAQE